MVKAIVSALTVATSALAQEAVEYSLSFKEAQTQYVDVSMTLRGVEAGALEVALPVWRPGKYALVEAASTVTGVKATSGKGSPLVCEKIDKSTWIVQPEPGDDRITVAYRMYCNSHSDRTRHVDDTHAFISPSAVMMYAPEFRSRPLRVKLDMPEGWKVSTGLESDGADLLAPDYDVLADSPLELGFHDRIEFKVEGIPHEIVTWTGRKNAAAGLGPAYDRAKLAEQFAKVVKAGKDIFGDLPYTRYVFMIHCIPGARGGTEHLNSTIMYTTPETFADAAGVKRFMNLVAHEHLHTWNVKQFRPAGLKPLEGLYDYQRENYTDLLWMVEGTTDYLEQVCLVREGIVTADEFVKGIGPWVDSARTRPGVSAQSATESSFDAWVKFNKTWPDAVNTTVSFYDKGCWLSLMLDMEIRQRSGNKASIDTLMRDLYRAFPLKGPGYTQEDVIRGAERLTASSFREFFADYIAGTKRLDFERALAVAGLEVLHDTGKKDDKEPPKERAYIGLNLGAGDGMASVSSVLADGPAYRAGLIAGDLVASVNGQRVRGSEDLDAILKRIIPGDTLKFITFRYDQVREVELRADGRFDGKWTVQRVKTPTEEQKAVYESWTGQKWPEKKGGDE